jgi:autotransporter family porin
MNCAFKVIWNTSRQVWMVVGELTKAHGEAKSATSNISTWRALSCVRVAFLTMGFACGANVAVAVSYWNVTTGDWTTGSHWQGGTAPTAATDFAVINNGGTAEITTFGVVAQEVLVGNTGSGTLAISNGGSVSNTFGTIGWSSGGIGSVSVDGTNSNWTNNNRLTIGAAGTGSLTISNGGTVSNTFGTISSNSDSIGSVTVDGAGSSWTNSVALLIGEFGKGTLSISNGGIVNVDSGNGPVTIAGQSASNGTLNIGAAASDTAIAAGILNAASVTFGTGTGKLVFNHTDTAYNFSPTITGSGAIGLFSGTTRFTGNAGNLVGYTGTLTVDGGTLLVTDGETLILGGNYTQTANGVFRTGVSSSSSYGKLVVTGIATLPNKAKIDVDVTNPNFNFSTTSLASVISAGTLVSDGTFVVSDNSALFNFSAVKNGNDVDLTLETVSTGENTEATGSTEESTEATGSAKSTGVSNAVNSKTSRSPSAGAALALDGLFDSFVANNSTGNADMDSVVTVLGKLATEAEVAQAVAETLPLLVGSSAQVATGTMHSTNRVIQGRQSGASGLSSGDDFITDKQAWVKPVGSRISQDERNDVAGYQANSYGLVGGIDGDLNDTTKLGLAASYMNTHVDGRDTAIGNKADIKAYQAIVYGSRRFDSVFDVELNWQADIGINNNAGKRVISFMGRTAKADYSSYTAHIGVGIGKRFELNDTTIVVPSIRADYAYIKDDSYTETGADALNLKVNGNQSDELIVMAQGNLNHQLNDRTILITDVGIGYNLLSEAASLTASYTGGGTAFTTKGIASSPWLASVGFGVNFATSDTTEVTVRYDLEGRKDFLNQTASVKLRWLF